MLFDAWEARYGEKRVDGVERLIHLCQNKVHLDVEPSALNAVSCVRSKLIFTLRVVR